MRFLTAFFSGAAGLCVILAATPAAEAQSVFQKLFGFASEPAPQAVPQPQVRHVIPPARLRNNRRWRSEASRAGRGETGPSDANGPYKTVCVRACDGFYFPIRHNARRRNFDSDVKSCRNACGDDGKLFYYPLRGPQGPEAMVDLAGRKYSDLPKAFAYRKALVQGCTCKPAPWSYEEAARHQSYADQEAIELEKDKAFLKARALAATKAKGAVAAADDSSAQAPVPNAVNGDGDDSASASAAPDAPINDVSESHAGRLEVSSAIKADFRDSAVTTAFDGAPTVAADTQPARRFERASTPRTITRRRPPVAAQRATVKAFSRRPPVRLPPKQSVGLLSLFGE